MHSENKQHTPMTALTLGALGVVFGDIGTSPLYALKECFHASHGLAITHDNVLGILSLIFWSITLVVSIKYVAFIMRADNNGEGGIMALLALSLRNKQVTPLQNLLLVSVGLFGAALFFGDGIITPAISVLSAVEGLKLVTPVFEPYVIPITIAVLVTLFVIQRHGTSSVGKLFGPVMLVWFSTLAVLGISNISQYPAVLQLINPLWAIEFISNHTFIAFVTLGAVVLTITGGEALYADMGHFGRKPINYAWFGLVLPALVLNYCGQGALLLTHPEAVENPFYQLAPSWFILPLIILATLATVIASQAVISGVFSIARQAMQLGYLPRFEVLHTSAKEIGQIYIPVLNWILLASIIILVLMFKSSSNLASAYGIAVTMTMICDTFLAAFVAITIWGWSKKLTLLVAVPLLLTDLAFFGATSLKFLQGGWFPVLIGISVFTIMLTWKQGREILFAKLNSETMPLNLFVNSIGAGSIQTIEGTAVFMTGTHASVPHALLHNIKHNKILHERNILLTLHTKDIPVVDAQDRLKIEQISPSFWLITGFYGFKEQPDVPELLALCKPHQLEFDMMDTSFFLSRERLIPRLEGKIAPWRELLFVAMSRNAASATDFFHIPTNRVVELGTQIEL
ncbi:potassium transporter Kup [Agitococcus lubricus]|uniref:Probable potassium transport system protein Kup n=1 Tax=Agitococcus lubricus TaxID=1077255 RepID=A0A2T5IUW2_9GAMM|nr:potassium transporter Kup [Agitococcus lubricus]PTQ87680.1 KUP system potassium uptake protein [Agitococcus lubricus]